MSASPDRKTYAIASSTSATTFLLFIVLAAPLMIAIWFVPWFVTQDGPLHVYNAYLLSALSDEHSPLRDFYAPRGGLLPYVGVYKLLAGLMSILSARAADRLLMTLTSLGFVCSVLWLRRRVVGPDGMAFIVPLALVIAFSRLWLLGLYSFLLGACLFALTLGLWWIWRNDLNLVRAVILAVLVAIGYFFHVISTGITTFALIVLAAGTPGQNRPKRLAWTAAAIAPSLALMISFGALMNSSGGAVAEWTGLTDPFSIQSWIQYLQAPDFISFSFKETVGLLAVPTDCPFVEQNALRYALLWPSLWLIAGVLLLVVSTSRNRLTATRVLKSEYRSWIVLAVCLFGAGFFGPSAAGQGSILRERVLLLGMVTLVPLINPHPKTSTARIAGLCLAVAALLQVAFVLDYARLSNRIAGGVMQVEPVIERGQRIALMVPDPRTHYIVNPLPGVANQLGVSRAAVVWNNYGPAYYYFPVAFRSEQVRDQWRRVDSLNQLLLSGEAEASAKEKPGEWLTAVGDALAETDVLIVWGAATWFDVLRDEWFLPEPLFVQGEVRAFRHK